MRSIYLVLVLLIFSTPAFSASELIMLNSPYCEWCEVWEEEVGIIYDKTREARIAPVRRVDIHDPRPDDLNQIKPVIYTPTFVLIDNGKEIGRIIGYPGEDFFWGLLNEMVGKLPVPLRACNEKRKVAAGAENRKGRSQIC